ncbi:MAG: isoaspartyl peptidase/L-asparaginase [Planctomycetes bacterium]|nr:isoaspartyl peptidase/L-asparaginase [Planctomycetota bacterium]
MLRYGVVVHGGVGSPAAWNDGCERAAEAAFRLLETGGHALDAVQAAAVILEDDGRYNAGSGSTLRLDGATIEMDASLMDAEGRIGVVAAVRGIKNPIRAAREVMNTPHVILSGDGAAAFARSRGVAEPHPGPGPRAQERFENVRRALGGRTFDGLAEAWRNFDLRAHWNFDVPYEKIFGHGDTIGAVALDREGRLAVANSTGGASPMLAGRIGDSPIVGSGFYAGPSAAVAGTGIGEEIIRRMLAREVHDAIAHGEEVAAACERAVARFPESVPVGVIAVSRRGRAAVHNRDMAWASKGKEE